VHFYDLEANVISLVFLALTVVKLWALVDAITRPAAAFPAADKQTKNLWLTLLGLAVATDVFFVTGALGLFMLAGTVASLVYIVDVRPAVRAIGRGGGGWNKRRPSGPRGGW
jgi:hypothetical protein